MFDISVNKVNENLVVKWQLTKIEIPISAIIEVTGDDTYGGEGKAAIRIGYPYGTTDRIVIKTKTETYILFTSVGTMKDKIVSYMNR